MRWTKLLTVLAVFALAFLAVGGLLRLAEVLGDAAASASLAVVVLVLVVGILAGTRRSGGPTNPYW